MDTNRTPFAPAEEGHVRVLIPSLTVLICLGLFVFIAPTIDWLPELTWHDLQRLAQIATLGAILPLAVISGPLRHAVWLEWLALPVVIRHLVGFALICGFVSSLNAQFPQWALLDWGLWTALVILFFVVAAARRTVGARSDIALILLLLMLTSALVVKALASYAAMFSHGHLFIVKELYSGFSNIRFFGHLQTITLPFLLTALMLCNRRPGYRMLLFVLTTLWWCLVIGSGTRGTWLGLAFAGIVIGSLGIPFLARWFKLGLLTALAGGTVYVVLVLWLPGLILDGAPQLVSRSGSLLSLSGREVIWTRAIEYWLAHPLLGVGPMHFANLSADIGMHPHNLLLQWLAEWGAPATVAWCAVLMFAAMALLRKTRLVCNDKDYPLGGPFMVAVAAALAGAAIQSQVDGVMVMPVSQVMIVVLAGWAAGFSGKRLPSHAGAGISRSGCAVALMLPVLMVTLLAIKAEPLVGELKTRQELHDSKENPDPMLPRFWAHGSISSSKSNTP